MYATKAEIARMFKISNQTVYNRVSGIQKEIGRRYNQYAIVDNLVSIGVYVDYEKYRKHLEDKNLRKYIPPFDMKEAEKYLEGIGKSKEKEDKKEKVNVNINKRVNAILLVCVDEIKMQKIVEYINEEVG